MDHNFLALFVWIFFSVRNFSVNSLHQTELPHIIVFVVSNVGVNDVGFRGSNNVETPNIDALAFSGVILKNYYTNIYGSQSRASFMTGQYPMRLGLHYGDMSAVRPNSIPKNVRIIPEYLRELGYRNHIVGKWHLGHKRLDDIPLFRGFNTHLGCWTGHQDYRKHHNLEEYYYGHDMRRDFNPDVKLQGKHATNIYTNRSIEIIETHNTSKPLFLYVAYTAVHDRKKPKEEMCEEDYIEFRHIIDTHVRCNFTVEMTRVDQSIGKITRALQARNMLENSIIVFTSDNGGSCEFLDSNIASSYPLKGCKGHLWEGGVRAPAFIWSKRLQNVDPVFNGQMHIVDWMFTLFAALPHGNAMKRMNFYPESHMDSVNHWNVILNRQNIPRPPIFLGGLYHHFGRGGHAIIKGKYKLLYGDASGRGDLSFVGDQNVGKYKDTYLVTSTGYTNGRKSPFDSYDPTLLAKSLAGKTLESINALIKPEKILGVRDQLLIECNDQEFFIHPAPKPDKKGNVKHVYLIDLERDPCEQFNEFQNNIDESENLINLLNSYVDEAVPPQESDPPPDWHFKYDVYEYDKNFIEEVIYLLDRGIAKFNTHPIYYLFQLTIWTLIMYSIVRYMITCNIIIMPRIFRRDRGRIAEYRRRL